MTNQYDRMKFQPADVGINTSHDKFYAPQKRTHVEKHNILLLNSYTSLKSLDFHFAQSSSLITLYLALAGLSIVVVEMLHL